MDSARPTIGLILAGGLGRRIGGDKPFRRLDGISLLERSIARLRGQVDRLIVNANDDPARFAAFGLPVVPDTLPDFPGPLAGILAGLKWVARHSPEIGWLVSTSVDAPFIPLDLVARLQAATDGRSRLALAASGGRTHPVVGLWPVGLRSSLHEYLAKGGRKVTTFTDAQAPAVVEWPIADHDPFLNINSQEDLDRVSQTLRHAAWNKPQ